MDHVHVENLTVRHQDRAHTFEALLYDHLVNHRRGQTERNRLPTTDRDRTGRSSRDTRYLEHTEDKLHYITFSYRFDSQTTDTPETTERWLTSLYYKLCELVELLQHL